MSVIFTEYEIASNLKQRRLVKTLVKDTIRYYTEKKCELHYVFCSDKYLLKINQDFLEHDTLTDIITFDLSNDNSDVIYAEIYISIERVKENALQLKLPYQNELLRVILHGALHLCGFKDKSPADEKKMRSLEEEWMKKL
ncbi:MAG: rRNA maturation RNase YbeY [Chitinophagaceae bacterium]|nr:rRNA maturation RNase YbeY [Chitinophagaceae bacterium]